MLKLPVAGVCVFVLISALVTPVRADVYREEAYKFTMDVPDSWKRISDADLRKIEEDAHRLAPAGTRSNYVYLAAFTKDPKGKIALPYIIVQLTDIPMAGVSYADLAKAFNAKTLDDATKPLSKSSGGALQNTSVSSATIDPARNRLTASMDMQASSVAPHTTIIGFFSTRGVVQLNLYSKPEKGASDAAELETIASTFRFDPGAEFVSGRSGGISPYGISQKMGSIAAMCLIGALVAWGVRKAIRK